MTDCGCDKARRDLEEYLRHEVCKTKHSDIAEHLESCPACRDEAHVARTLTDVVAPFTPEGGAYGHGRTHSHEHGATAHEH